MADWNDKRNWGQALMAANPIAAIAWPFPNPWFCL